MSKRYIATKLHLTLEAGRNLEFFQRAPKLPHFVIDDSLIDLMQRSDVTSSIQAMIAAEICRLPFPEMLIELPVGHGGELRCFVILEERPDEIVGYLAMYDHKFGRIAVDETPYTFTPMKSEEFATAQAIAEQEGFERLPEGPLRNEIGKATEIFDRMPEEGPDTDNGPLVDHRLNISTMMAACKIALLMLNIQGVGKEVITPTKLNKHRIARGQPSVPHHTVMRIAHVYDRDGNRHAIGSHKRTVAVHMRAGHARQQHYGPGNADIKVVYIPPVLVNFRPGVEVPVPKRIIAA